MLMFIKFVLFRLFFHLQMLHYFEFWLKAFSNAAKYLYMSQGCLKPKRSSKSTKQN